MVLYAWAAGTPRSELVFADVVHQHRAEDAGGGPGGQQAPVNRAHELGAEHVGQVRGDGGEAAAVHA